MGLFSGRERERESECWEWMGIKSSGKRGVNERGKNGSKAEAEAKHQIDGEECKRRDK